MMLGTTAEQDELRASVRRFLTDRAPLTRVRELMESEDGTDRGVWEQAGTQLGLQGLAVPEAYGGAGFSFAEQAIVLEEFGAALYGGPYLASAVLAATALLASPDEGARRDLLPGIASGEVGLSQTETLPTPDGSQGRRGEGDQRPSEPIVRSISRSASSISLAQSRAFRGACLNSS